jgi:hypothetical protein
MFSKLHERFGTAGLIVAIVALVAALAGTAFAAGGGLNGKQKKEVKKIAKEFAGKNGPQGPTGPQGPSGPQGPAGAAGKDGTNGTKGKSVKVTEIEVGEPECAELGGAEVEVEESGNSVEVCNGRTGFTATLPPGETETGTWTAGIMPVAEEEQWVSISFAIPLASELAAEKAHFINEAGKEVVINESTFEYEELASHPNCPGSAVSPTAVAGHLCLYAAEELGLKKTGPPLEWGIFGAKPGAALGFSSFHNAEAGLLASFGVSKAGAAMQVKAEQAGAHLRGTWAVTD